MGPFGLVGESGVGGLRADPEMVFSLGNPLGDVFINSRGDRLG